jgi:hypothetical protein
MLRASGHRYNRSWTAFTLRAEDQLQPFAARVAGRVGLGALLALVLASCGGANSKQPDPPGGSAAGGPPARIPSVSPAAMTSTPAAELAFCRKDGLLRAVCPRRIPTGHATRGSPSRHEYYCNNGDPHETARQTLLLFPTSRCVFAEWGYETFAPLPGATTGALISAWDGTAWFVPSYAPLTAPPWHVHIDLQASVGSSPPGGGFAWPTGAQSASDALLNPSRNRAVSLGWVHWYGKYGQLVVAPTNANGGLWAGHVIFSYTVKRVHYDITLHAWASKERFSRNGANQVIAFDSGPALPHVIATLKAIVGSAS